MGQYLFKQAVLYLVLVLMMLTLCTLFAQFANADCGTSNIKDLQVLGTVLAPQPVKIGTLK